MTIAARQGPLGLTDFTQRLLTSSPSTIESNFDALNRFGWSLEDFTAALRVGAGCCAPDPASRMKLVDAREALVAIIRRTA